MIIRIFQFFIELKISYRFLAVAVAMDEIKEKAFMKILVTGAGGFNGKNLVSALKNIEKGLDHTHNIKIEAIYEFHHGDSREVLQRYCKVADFVFHLAGVNRPKDKAEFVTGNVGLSRELLACLEAVGNDSPVMVASSLQATLAGRFVGSDYGKSKQDAEALFFAHAQKTGAKVFVYRFPNVFGKWCRPEYNSAVATFCHHMANDLSISVNDPLVELELVYIDDLVTELLDALEGKPHRCRYESAEPVTEDDGDFCSVPVTYHVRLGDIVKLLQAFKSEPKTLQMPAIPADSFAKKLYSTYLSYLPAEAVKFSLAMKCDERGSFTELLKTLDGGQFSVNVSKPGITKGQHWHQSKWEFFIVVSGRALIQERRVGVDDEGKPYPVLNFEVSGDKIEAVHMLPGYTHSIVNLSKTDNLVTLMWANESFDPAHPDTFYEPVC